MKKKIIVIVFLCLIIFCLDIKALKIGNVEIIHDLVPNWRKYSSWYKQKRDDKYHWGVDIPAPKGAPVNPGMDGTIWKTGYDRKLGNYVKVAHQVGNEWYSTTYGHLSKIDVTVGKEVGPSTKIGEVGCTGKNSTCNHLHYALTNFRATDDPFIPPREYRHAPYDWDEKEPTKGLEDEDYKKWKGPTGGDDTGGEDDSMDSEEEEDGEEDDEREPGGDRPDDNESFATSNPSSLISDSKSRFYRLAPKKGKAYILHLWNLEKLLEERGRYFKSIGSGGTPDETYLNNLNTKINENYNLLSVNNLQYRKERSETPDVVILRHGYFGSTSSLINKSSEAWRRVIPSFSPLWVKENPLMVIPTGGLYGMDNSEQFKSTLADYVSQGGTLVVFAQQRRYEFTALPTPDEEPIEAYGWREDQSCRSNSMYVDTWHPALSSTTKSLISSPIDGYFAGYPSNSTVLLSRRINGMPAMLAYPYGEGRVVVTSMFEDWGYSHGQSTAQGRAIVRDLITWAKNPDLEIPEYNLRNNPDPELSLF